MAFHLPAGLGQDRPPSGSSTDYLTIILFNYYVSTYPGSSELCISYADDFTAFASNTKVDRAADALAEHAGYITYWAQAEEPPYLGSEIFEFKLLHLHLSVPLDGTPLRLERNPEILGVTLALTCSSTNVWKKL